MLGHYAANSCGFWVAFTRRIADICIITYYWSPTSS